MKQRSGKGGASSAPTHEGRFWQMVRDTTATGWTRYHPLMALALGSSDAAIVLGDSIHRSCLDSRSPMGKGWFYMSAAQWSRELGLSVHAIGRAVSVLAVPLKPRLINFSSSNAGGGKVRAARMRCASVGLLVSHVMPVDVHPVTHYAVHWQKLLTWWDETVKRQADLLSGTKSISSITRNQFGENYEIDFLSAGISITNWPGNQFVAEGETSGEDGQGMSGQGDDESEDDPPNASPPVVVAGRAGAARSDADKATLNKWLSAWGIEQPTRGQLIEELTGVPLHRIESVMNKSVDMRWNEDTKITNWGGFRVSLLRALVGEAAGVEVSS